MDQSRHAGNSGARLILENAYVAFDLGWASSPGLLSILDRESGQEFLHAENPPLYRMILWGRGTPVQKLTSHDAVTVSANQSEAGGFKTLTVIQEKLGRHAIRVTCTGRLASDSRLAQWRIAVQNETHYGVRAIFYPVILARPSLEGDDIDDVYVSGTGFGLLAHKPGRMLRKPPPQEDPDDADALPTNFCAGEYPGPVTVQMQAYYGARAGLYVATYDSEGYNKKFGYTASEKRDALDLSIEHHYDERPGLDFSLSYDTVVGTFHGDWYDAADIYKDWAHQQHWCARKLKERDVPEWFTEPRPHLMIISRGGVDRAQATLPSPLAEYPIDKFWPARNAAAQIEQHGAYLDSPAVAWLEGWEKIGAPGGPVDIFPPYEGEESFKAATARLHEHGHIVSLYLAGLHWCYRRATVGYYGEERFEREGRPLSVLNDAGEITRYVFGSAQKHFTNLCVGSQGVVDLYRDNFRQLAELGGDWLQLDQQIGLFSPVCYSEDHGHPVGYGRWMYERMLAFVRNVRAEARKRNPLAAFTCENACEIWIQEIDGFMDRPYMSGDVLHALPIFEYVYHEYAIAYGGDIAMWLHHVEAACIKHAAVCVCGMQNLIAIGEPDYDIDVKEVDHPVMPLLKSIVQAQRTFAREYLVFGKMLRPAPLTVRTIPIELWWPPTATKIRMIFKDIPAVMHSSWKSQEGKVAHVLVNWTGTNEPVSLQLGSPNAAAKVFTASSNPQPLHANNNGALHLEVPARAVILVEAP